MALTIRFSVYLVLPLAPFPPNVLLQPILDISPRPPPTAPRFNHQISGEPDKFLTAANSNEDVDEGLAVLRRRPSIRDRKKVL